MQYYGFANDNLTYLQVNQLSLDLIDPQTFKASFESDAWLSNITEYQVVAATKLNAALSKIAKDGQDINTALREEGR